MEKTYSSWVKEFVVDWRLYVHGSRVVVHSTAVNVCSGRPELIE